MEIIWMPSEKQEKPKLADRLLIERDDIAQRVANFRAHQAKLEQERDAYYQVMRARIRKTLGPSSTDPAR
jgi:hypothetical protein